MGDAVQSRLLSAIKDLLKNGDYSDLVVTCGSDTYNVHKAIVCPQVGFFAGAVRFAVGQEAEDGRVDLSEDDSTAVRLLMQYLYERDYAPRILSKDGLTYVQTRPVNLPEKDQCGLSYTYGFPHTCGAGCVPPHHLICVHHNCMVHCGRNCRGFICKACEPPIPDIRGDAHQLLTHAQLYHLADKYEIPGLAPLAKEKFLRACAKHWDHDEFPVAAKFVYSSTPEEYMGLRDTVIKTVAGHMRLLNKLPTKELIRECNGLVAGILELLAEDLGWLKLSRQLVQDAEQASQKGIEFL